MTYADQVLDALGGTSEVARLIESPTSTVHSWRKIGIPSSRLAHLRLIAAQQGVALPEQQDLADSIGGGCRKSPIKSDVGISGAQDACPPADNSPKNICRALQAIEKTGEADSHGPFSALQSTSSSTRNGPSAPSTNPACSTGAGSAMSSSSAPTLANRGAESLSGAPTPANRGAQ